MNYYEELGIRSDADEEEIRKAHRRLVKLMHPDQHRDAGLKQLAETQMRRLNSIVATLLDPEERREYDDQLRGGEASNAAPHQSTWRSVPWWIASTLGAIVLTVGTVYFFADHLGSGLRSDKTPTTIDGPVDTKPLDTGKMYPPTAPPVKQTETDPLPPPTVTPKPESQPETTTVVVPGPEKSKPPVVVKTSEPSFPPPPAPEIKKPVQAKVVDPPKPAPPAPPSHPLATKPIELARNTPPAIRPAPSPAVLTPKSNQPTNPDIRKLKEVPMATAKPGRTQTPDPNLGPPSLATASLASGPGWDIPPPPTSVIPPPVMTSRGSRDPLEGEWVYAPTEPEKHKPGLYPPDFIQLRLKKDTSGMRGEYSARYSITDNRPVSPNVSFVLKATDQKALRYTWTSADGSSGWLLIRSLEPDTMRLEWKATRFHGGPALTSGMATLVRKN